VVRLRQPDSQELWSAARQLVDAYANALGVDLAFQDFGREIESLAIDYGPPDGCFFLAEEAGVFVGCGGLRRFADRASACEMKRLYVLPSCRGHGIGRRLAEALVEEARRLGYDQMLLDTLPSMKEAHALYASLGFRPTAPYRYNPVAGTAFLELELR
jgi:GNAT superfamily N-acetyltransferase